MGYYSYLGKTCQTNLAYEIGGNLVDYNPVFLCVGSSQVVADSFGPLVGELLIKKYGIKRVFGNLEHNITSKNLNEVYNLIKLKYPTSKIVIIDAALSQEENVGIVKFLNTGCVPACNTNLKVYGDFSLLGLTNVVGINSLYFLKTVKFNMILNMAQFLASTINKSLELIKSVNFNTKN